MASEARGRGLGFGGWLVTRVFELWLWLVPRVSIIVVRCIKLEKEHLAKVNQVAEQARDWAGNLVVVVRIPLGV